jgi:hypothetical protein
MRGLTTRYPDDLEAAAFTSLALMLAIDEDAFPSDTMKVRAKQMVERAEHVFKANPNHPGAAHYLIHVSDLDPSFSTSALPAARAYARIAPDASHALHMPSHVFLRLGLWDEVASSNEQSWAASRREMARDKLSGAELDSHSLRFLAYAYLEGGRWSAARALADSARRVIGNADVYGASHVDTRYTISDLTFLDAAETGRWNDAVLPPVAQGPPQNPRERFFATSAEYARVVIQAMRGDTAALAAGAAAFRSRANAAGPRRSVPESRTPRQRSRTVRARARAPAESVRRPPRSRACACRHGRARRGSQGIFATARKLEPCRRGRARAWRGARRRRGEVQPDATATEALTITVCRRSTRR